MLLNLFSIIHNWLKIKTMLSSVSFLYLRLSLRTRSKWLSAMLYRRPTSNLPKVKAPPRSRKCLRKSRKRYCSNHSSNFISTRYTRLQLQRPLFPSRAAINRRSLRRRKQPRVHQSKTRKRRRPQHGHLSNKHCFRMKKTKRNCRKQRSKTK